MVDVRRPSHFVILVGTALAVVSAFLPWFEAKSEVASFAITPATSDITRSSVWIVLLGLVVGLGVFILRASPALLGCAAAIWVNVSLIIWFTGAKASVVIPGSVLPENAALRLGVGASLGLAGGLVLLVGCSLVLAEQTWNLGPMRSPRWFSLLCLMAIVACLSVREFAWFHVAAGSFRWSLDFDVLPVVGDGLSLTIAVAVTLVTLQFLRPRRWVAYGLVADAILMGVLSLIAVGSNSVLERAAREVLSRVRHLKDLNTDVGRTNGPVVSSILALALACFAFASVKVTTPGTTSSARRLRLRLPNTAPGRVPAAQPMPDDDLPF